jgi:hypothetical protein
MKPFEITIKGEAPEWIKDAINAEVHSFVAYLKQCGCTVSTWSVTGSTNVTREQAEATYADAREKGLVP